MDNNRSNAGSNSVVSGGGEFMLFGVRVVVDSMRKSVSMNNLSQYEEIITSTTTNNSNNNNNDNSKEKDELAVAVAAAAAATVHGYASADDAVHNSTGNRERKRGVPWTEDEHKLFLVGLQNVGKGDWRGISRNFVKTRTPTQVASHAQKYFLRQSNLNRRRRRSSLFDITTDSVNIAKTAAMEEEQVKPVDDKITAHSPPRLVETTNASTFSMMPPPLPLTTNAWVANPMQCNNLPNNVSINPVCPIPAVPLSNLDLNLNDSVEPSSSSSSSSSLSLKLSLTSDQRESSSRRSDYQAMPNFSNGDSSNRFISVA